MATRYGGSDGEDMGTGGARFMSRSHLESSSAIQWKRLYVMKIVEKLKAWRKVVVEAWLEVREGERILEVRT